MRVLVPFLALALASTSVDGAELRGEVRLRDGGKLSREVRNAVVWWEPAVEVVPDVPESPFEIVTVRKEFLPRVLAVPTGATVRFPNEDPILHNVFSLSPENRFDLGLYRQGEGKTTTFEQSGIIRVYCNVHHSMVAHVVVLDTPWFTSPDREGKFVLEGLPDGPGRLRVWHEQAEALDRDLELPAAGPVELDLEVSRPRIPLHTNKFGKPYPRSRRGRGYS